MDFGRKVETNCCDLDPQIRALPRESWIKNRRVWSGNGGVASSVPAVIASGVDA
jgi:hypothetical protein